MNFKTCTTCLISWTTRDEFLKSPNIRLIGYQPNFELPDDGLLLFNHVDKKCGTTMALQVGLFSDLYGGPTYQELKKGLPECGGYCLNVKELSACGAQCSMAHIRKIMQIIVSMQTKMQFVPR
jgi:hypothetical protein